MTKREEPPGKRRKLLMKVPDDSISLTHYCSGRRWHVAHDKSRNSVVAIENKLFALPEYWADDDVGEISASDDFGESWHAYSRLPLRMNLDHISPVYAKSGTIVYLFMFERELVGQTYENSKCQVWLSKDLLRTFQLVCANPEFGDPGDFHCFPRDDGAFCVHVFAEHEWHSAWISRDMGVSWQLESPVRMEAHREAYNSLTYHMGRLYGLGYRALLYSDDGGNRWAAAELPFIPKLLVKDYRVDRIICFSSSECFELIGDATQWKRVDSDWKEVMATMKPGRRQRPVLSDVLLMRDGVMILSAYLNTSRVVNVVSYPESERAQRDKNRLAYYLSAKGIYSPLFQAHIAPFLFPY